VHRLLNMCWVWGACLTEELIDGTPFGDHIWAVSVSLRYEAAAEPAWRLEEKPAAAQASRFCQ
jgi:hypothetical protein